MVDHPKHASGYVLLSTVLIKLIANNGREVVCKESQINLITQHAVNKLKILSNKSQVHIQGIGGSNRKTKGRINIAIQSLSSEFSSRIEAFVLKSIVHSQPNLDKYLMI